MIVTKTMTARRTEQFLKEMRFELDDIQRTMIAAYAKNGELAPISQEVGIRLDYMKHARLPSEGNYVVQILTSQDDYESP